jgi:hypothetical protein
MLLTMSCCYLFACVDYGAWSATFNSSHRRGTVHRVPLQRQIDTRFHCPVRANIPSIVIDCGCTLSLLGSCNARNQTQSIIDSVISECWLWNTLPCGKLNETCRQRFRNAKYTPNNKLGTNLAAASRRCDHTSMRLPSAPPLHSTISASTLKAGGRTTHDRIALLPKMPRVTV